MCKLGTLCKNTLFGPLLPFRNLGRQKLKSETETVGHSFRKTYRPVAHGPDADRMEI